MAEERVVSSRTRPRVEPVEERRDVESMLEIDYGNADPEFIYRFVHDDKLNVTRKRMKGFRPVTKEDGVTTMVETDDSADGLIRVGDTILMKCPREKVLRRRKARQELADSRLRVPKKKVKNMAKKYKVDVIEDRDSRDNEED